MKYYKVKPEFDSKYIGQHVLVADELYTSKEMEKLHIKHNCCEVVEISRNKTYWFFGARFAYQEGGENEADR